MGKIFYGWVVVLAAAIGLLFSFLPLVGLTFGVFSKSVSEEFGWERAEIAAAHVTLPMKEGLPVSDSA